MNLLMLIPTLIMVQIESPVYTLYNGAVEVGALRANIISASYVLSEIPTGATVTLSSGNYVTYRAGDRASVNDATFAYIFDGTDWLPLFNPYLDTARITESFTGDNSLTTYTLGYVTSYETLEVHCITDAHIPNTIDWNDGQHCTFNINGDGNVISVTPIYKWFTQCTFRFRYKPVPSLE